MLEWMSACEKYYFTASHTIRLGTVNGLYWISPLGLLLLLTTSVFCGTNTFPSNADTNEQFSEGINVAEGMRTMDGSQVYQHNIQEFLAAHFDSTPLTPWPLADRLQPIRHSSESNMNDDDDVFYDAVSEADDESDLSTRPVLKLQKNTNDEVESNLSLKGPIPIEASDLDPSSPPLDDEALTKAAIESHFSHWYNGHSLCKTSVTSSSSGDSSGSLTDLNADFGFWDLRRYAKAWAREQRRLAILDQYSRSGSFDIATEKPILNWLPSQPFAESVASNSRTDPHQKESPSPSENEEFDSNVQHNLSVPSSPPPEPISEQRPDDNQPSSSNLVSAAAVQRFNPTFLSIVAAIVPWLSLNFPTKSIKFPFWGGKVIDVKIKGVKLSSPTWLSEVVQSVTAESGSGLYLGDGFIGLRLVMETLNGTGAFSTNYPRFPQGNFRFSIRNLSIGARIRLPYDESTRAISIVLDSLVLDVGDVSILTGYPLLNFAARWFKRLNHGILKRMMEGMLLKGLPAFLQTFLSTSLTLPLGGGGSNTMHVQVKSPPLLTAQEFGVDFRLASGYSAAIGSAGTAAVVKMITTLIPRLGSAPSR